MKYVLFLCAPAGDEETADGLLDAGPRTADWCADGPGRGADPRLAAYADEVRRRAAGRGGARLRTGADATTVRVRDAEVLLSDGPFTRADAYIAAFDVVEVADLDEAIALAARHPAALGGGAVEVRPVWE
ncbi:YciI family protein [Streptomyces mangrovisoli]|uniref:YciI family protein n=1 Tax=Streptomyces mangrovisoli TaxID=1428628 RepID=UPI0006215BD5|nr:YciI family protein [Streptomyces mangrovisoli]